MAIHMKYLVEAAFSEPQTTVAGSARQSTPISRVPPRPISLSRGIAALGMTLALAACGGSGGGSSDAGTGAGTGAAGGNNGAGTGAGTGTITKFPLQAAYTAYVRNGYTQQFKVTGECDGKPTQGTATQRSSSPPQDAKFDNAAALAIVLTGSLQLPGCNTPQSASISVQYFDDKYSTLGAIAADGSVARYDTPLTMPVFVTVGDGGTLGTQRLFTNSTTAAPMGKTVQGYSVRADSATSVLVELQAETFDAADRLQVKQKAIYRLSEAATFEVVSIDVSYPVSNGLHLVLTPQ